MRWAIVFAYLFARVVYETAGVREIEPNQDWISQVGVPSRNRQSNCPNCKCGIPKSNERIIGGQNTKNTKYPWITYVQSNTAKGNFSCGGALINDRYVLCAAHCLITTKENTMVILGLDDLHNLKNMKLKKIEEIIIHKGWNPNKNYDDDIALIKLTTPVDFSADQTSPDYICPVCLAEAGSNFLSADVTAIGWGLTKGKNGKNAEVLQEVHLPVVDDRECRRTFGLTYFKAATMVCVGTKDGSKGVCQGDSGGPLHYWNEGTGTGFYQQIGIVSYVKEYCRSFGVFTRVNQYLDWITQHTGDACYCAQPT